MLNKKGFTLVELLAVVAVLALIVGIAIPISMRIISNSKYRALLVNVDEAEKFVGDQWKLKKVDPDSMTDAFKKVIDEEEYEKGDFIELDSSNTDHPEQRELMEEMGIDPENVKKVYIQVDDSDIPCVIVSEIYKDSDLNNSDYWNDTFLSDDIVIPSDYKNKGYYSKCCSAEKVQELIGDEYGKK